jgi:hypothetical protein
MPIPTHRRAKVGALSATVASLLVMCAGTSATSAHRSVAACRSADATSATVISILQTLATSTKPADVALKDSLHLSIRRASDVSLITDEQTCIRAAGEMDKLWQTGPTTRQVYVFKVGSDFGVEDPVAGSGEHQGLAFFDRKWAYKSLLVAP